MNITTRVTKLDNPESKLKALATIVLNGNFAVGGIKVIETEKGMYVASCKRIFIIRYFRTNYYFDHESEDERNQKIVKQIKQ